MISTSYLIGEIVVIPLHRLSQPGVLVPQDHPLFHATLFALFSVACASTRPPIDDRDARPAGLFRRRADPDAFTLVFTNCRKWQPSDLRCRAGRHLLRRDRPDHRRLSHRKLRLQTIFFVNVVRRRQWSRCSMPRCATDAA